MATTIKWGNHRIWAAGLCAALIASFAAAGDPAEAARKTGEMISVIVQGFTIGDATAAVENAGGDVTRDLPIVNGVTAEVPRTQLGSLRTSRKVVSVTRNSKIGFQQAPETSAPAAAIQDFTRTPERIGRVTGSSELWNRGIDGSGVTVALLDTGVYNHPDLAGRVICGADLTAEAGTEANCQDTFGHGTFMAGLIAGDGTSSDGVFKGSAPGARIVSVKASGFNGATDVSTVLAGIQWIVAHKDEYGIDVLNLSFGSDSRQPYTASPLNYAVEKAWMSGITVVVSAANAGNEGSKTIMKPADDPYVITVGSSDDEGTISTADDTVSEFSSRGPTRTANISKPDVVAPGEHTVSLRSPGSGIDQMFGSSAVVDDMYFRGSGTSMSAATVSGIVAQLLQADPSLSPDQLKYRLTATAGRITNSDPFAVGRGIVNAQAASDSTTRARANVGIKAGVGNGKLGYDRGTIEIEAQTAAGSLPLTGEITGQTDSKGKAATYSTDAGNGWDVASWNRIWGGKQWAGASWKGASWKATGWDGASWKGASWKNADWDGASWKDSSWDGASWKDSSWDGASWKDSSWEGASWRASSWMTYWYAAGWN